jgi:phosphatidyl-myo-inositol dimannoside synthase
MNILYITRKYPPSIGGMQTQSYEFHQALKKQANVRIIAWGGRNIFLPLFVISALIRGCYFLIRHKIDIIQVGDLVLSPVALLLKMLFRKPALTMAHGRDTAMNTVVYRKIVFGSSRQLDGIICVSTCLKEMLLKKGMPEKLLFVNPNGICVSASTKLQDKEICVKEVEARCGINLKGKKILLSVSRLVRKKGIAKFVRNILPGIVAEIPETVLVLVGNPTSQEAKQEKAEIQRVKVEKRLEQNVIFIGGIAYEDKLLSQIYRASDIFVMPNRYITSDCEGFGIVTLEASKNEVPVVAFAVDGITEAVKNKCNGVLIKGNDNAGFTKAVVTLLHDEKKRVALGKNAREFVNCTFDWGVITDRYLKILSEVLKMQRSCASRRIQKDQEL